MSYHIYAWIENSKPKLKIVDSVTGAIYLTWTYNENHSIKSDKKEIQRLFKELLLLTCKQTLCNSTTYRINSFTKQKIVRLETSTAPIK